MPEFEIIFYEKENGTSPAREFILSLDKKMRAKIAKAIGMLAIKGNKLREPLSKPLGDGIFELRAQIATDISRVFYFFMVGKRAVLTHGFIKKTNKTPPDEIERAKRYRYDYLKRRREK